jgi:Zn-dependent protease with chaperone function
MIPLRQLIAIVLLGQVAESEGLVAGNQVVRLFPIFKTESSDILTTLLWLAIALGFALNLLMMFVLEWIVQLGIVPVPVPLFDPKPAPAA